MAFHFMHACAFNIFLISSTVFLLSSTKYMLIYSVITNKIVAISLEKASKEIAVLSRLLTFKDTFFVRLYIIVKRLHPDSSCFSCIISKNKF